MAHAVTEEVLPQALQLEEIIREQANGPTFRELTDLCGPDALFYMNASGLLVRKVSLDGAEQIVIMAHSSLEFCIWRITLELPDTPVLQECSDLCGDGIFGRLWQRT
jgi:hypothetical protein